MRVGTVLKKGRFMLAPSTARLVSVIVAVIVLQSWTLRSLALRPGAGARCQGFDLRQPSLAGISDHLVI